MYRIVDDMYLLCYHNYNNTIISLLQYTLQSTTYEVGVLYQHTVFTLYIIKILPILCCFNRDVLTCRRPVVEKRSYNNVIDYC